MAADPYRYFRVEARELVDQLVKGALELERGAGEEVIPRLLRLAHTLKGAARVVKHTEIANHAHAVEDALTALRDAPPGQRRADAVLKCLDSITSSLEGLKGPAPAAASEPAAPVADGAFRDLRGDLEELDEVIEGLAEAHVPLASLQRDVDTIERLQRTQERLVDQLRALLPPLGARASPAISVAEEVARSLASLRDGALSHLEQIDRELRQVRETAERVRLLPVRLLWNALERTVRDTGQALERRVRFEGAGGEIRLDSQVLGVLQSALVQLARNAVAHGLESEAERTQAGKPAEGTVRVEAIRRGSRVAFVCSDDGRGIDVEAVRRAARQKGVPLADDPKGSAQELLQVLLRGGITTSGTVSAVSGRGIGLDVVREAITRLGGDLSVETHAGKGTRFELLVPVSMTSLDALLVEVGPQTAVLPLDAVRATARIAAGDLVRTPEGLSVVVSGRTLPFLPLAEVLSPALARPPPRLGFAAIIEAGARHVALGVDRLAGRESVVLRRVPPLTAADGVITGVTLDAFGDPRVVLDPAALVQRAIEPVVRPAPPAAARPPILVVDDSLTTRMLEQSILESAGYEVEVAVSGEEALVKARQRTFGLMLVDVEMPGMDGFEVLERVGREFDSLPAILVTSRNAPEDRRRGEEVGARGYVVKSEFDQVRLLELIREIVGA